MRIFNIASYEIQFATSSQFLLTISAQHIHECTFCIQFMQMKKNKCKGSIFHLQTIQKLWQNYISCRICTIHVYDYWSFYIQTLIFQPIKKLFSLQLAIQSFSYIKRVNKSLGSIISIKYLNRLYKGETYVHNDRVTVKLRSVWLSMWPPPDPK